MAKIRVENVNHGSIEKNKVFGQDAEIEVLDSDYIDIIENIVSNSPIDDPLAFIDYLNESQEVQTQIEDAGKGNNKAIAFLKSLGEKITVEIVSISFKAYLKAHGIEI